jgi:glycosyltransferase involved in cell wall biosynthesis
MPRICIDGFNLAMPHGSGIATYARNLARALTALSYETEILYGAAGPLGADERMNRRAVFDDAIAARRRVLTIARRFLPPTEVRAREISVPADPTTAPIPPRYPVADRVWAAHDLFHAANKRHVTYGRFTPVRLGDGPGPDVMHWTCPLPLEAPGVANVYTLHDLVPLRLPDATLDNKRAYYAMCRTIAQRADRVFTVSEHSRRDIIELLGVDGARVVNTYQAVELPEHWRGRDADSIATAVESRFGFAPQSYFLFFGALEPKKNLDRLVQAFLASGVKASLVIVGRRWRQRGRRFGLPSATSTAPNIPSHDRIRRYDYMPAERLRTLIAGARATLFPSLYEGFGLPVLESMLLGAPVLTSTSGSLPEVAGDAALLVDPYDVDAIKAGIRQLDADVDLRRALSERGALHAAKFSPERYRERLQAAYAPVL